MAWYSDGGFHIRRDKLRDSPGNGKCFTLHIYVGNGETKVINLTKTDVLNIRREAARALKQLDQEES